MRNKNLEGKKLHLRREVKLVGIPLLLLLCIASVLVVWMNNKDTYHNREEMKLLRNMKEQGKEQYQTPKENGLQVLSEYSKMRKKNPDLIGWLYIQGTPVDYPVMQTPKEEEYYLHRDFNQEDNKNGCLIMDTDSSVGIGCKEENYLGGSEPSTNLIIHGHNMKSKDMFGSLTRYEKKKYEKKHSVIQFDSLYEHREYDIISVFYSKVYKKTDTDFKFYQFFNAPDETSFQIFYDNIKQLSIYDTGVTAKYGDEFITLSTCSYQEENGRFVVVAKRK